MEIWKPVKNFENLYEVSNIGRIKSKDRIMYNQYNINTKTHDSKRLSKGKILVGSKTPAGYKRVILVDINGNRNYESVHVLVAEAFCEKPDTTEKLIVNHKNGRKLDNRANNLEWTTYKGNTQHARKTGLWKNVHFNKKPVLNITTGKQYESAIAAARDIHKEIPTTKIESIMKNIKACCNGKQLTAYKYKWKNL